MTIGDAFFSRLSVRGFDRLAGEIAAIQSRIASGVNDPRPSADPVRADGLSALRDQLARLDGREAAVNRAADRLALTDAAMADMAGVARSWQQVALRAASATLTAEGAAALRAETSVLRDRLLAAANATDATDRPLFAGTAPGPAYARENGAAAYRGNEAAVTVQVGDRRLLAAGLTGPQVFGSGDDSLFARLDRLAAALREPMLPARAQASATGPARLDIRQAPGGGTVSVTLAGPAGAAPVTLDQGAGAAAAAVAAINAVSADTGVTAALTSDGTGVALSGAGTIGLSGVDGGGTDLPALVLTPTDAGGAPAGPAVSLRPVRLSLDGLVADAAAAVERLAAARGAAGALAADAARETAVIADRRLQYRTAVEGLQGLDIAAEATRLQALLTTQQAAQQTYVRISGRSLFDFLR